jgi:hypothetical protein
MITDAISAILPPALERAARRCYPLALLAADRIVPILRLEGATRTGKAAMIVAGVEPWVYDLPNRFFRGSPRRTLLARAPVWKVERVLKQVEETADLTLARVDRLTAGLVFREKAVRIPDWVAAGIDLPVDIGALARAHGSLRDDMRLIRRSGFGVEISHDDHDLPGFYRTMYVPFSRMRHGEVTSLRPEAWLLKRFRRGGLIWITHNGGRVAGILFEQAGSVLHLWAEGTKDGDTSLMKTGIVSAMYFHALTHAMSRGCGFADFGGCHACLTDGLLRHKRKWGMALRRKPDNYYYALLRWRKWNPMAAAFLADVPVLHETSQGLLAVTALTDSDPAPNAAAEQARKSLWMPGLRRMVVVNGAGWRMDQPAPENTALLAGDPTPEDVISV